MARASASSSAQCSRRARATRAGAVRHWRSPAHDERRTVKKDRADLIFTALADATRREVIRALSAQGPSTATGLAASLPVTRQAVTKHLSALADAGLVTATRRGREKLYQISP